MRTRFLQILLASFWFLWTALILPSHTPGVVTIGAPAQAAAGVPRCPFCPPAKSKAPPAPCALCDLKVKLYSGTIVVPVLAPAGLVEIARATQMLQAPFHPTPHAFQSRAPPAIFAA